MSDVHGLPDQVGNRRPRDVREARTIAAFVALADSLAERFDVVDQLDRLAGHCAELLDVDAVGVVLLDGHDHLRVAASTDEQTDWMGLFQVEVGEGPAVDCVRSGTAVGVPDPAAGAARWPGFVEALSRGGVLGAVHALPLRLRGETIGAVSLFRRRPGGLSEADLGLGQALADVATIGVLAERTAHRGQVLAEQLKTALNSRVAIEQAKGVLAQRGGLTLDAAFDRLRRYARSHDRRLAEIATEVVGTDLVADDVLGPVTVADRER
ncbi:GAF domain-containing protein [Pseudonocardia sediminis]|uniref:GAF domain-containing protein n=1 Tax=Pseudonocardia sediminis TaxID=1397368 RepID=A0A4Q7V0T9_PSEST|nr:GAF and ANTAR domain-containing protein [Pseudonocardia sediminis]RZT86931.1 GAF domain-containing protein [Pseudonocardia sediminis]